MFATCVLFGTYARYALFVNSRKLWIGSERWIECLSVCVCLLTLLLHSLCVMIEVEVISISHQHRMCMFNKTTKPYNKKRGRLDVMCSNHQSNCILAWIFIEVTVKRERIKMKICHCSSAHTHVFNHLSILLFAHFYLSKLTSFCHSLAQIVCMWVFLWIHSDFQ